MNIRIKILTGKIINFEIDSEYLINKIKDNMQEIESVDQKYINIMLDKKILNDTLIIKDSKINDDSILQLFLSLRGK
jgi:hypothetical protein